MSDAPAGAGATEEAGPTPVRLHAVDRRVLAFERIGAPLLAAVSDWRFSADGEAVARTPEDDARLFAELMSNAAAVARATAARSGAATGQGGEGPRWRLAAAASDIVTAHFRATGKALGAGDVDRIVATVEQSVGLVEGAGEPGASLLRPPLGPAGAVDLRARLMDSLAPVVGAVARFAFGEDARALLTEIVTKLHGLALQAVQAIAPDEREPARLDDLYHAALHATAELYADCHYGEMDRLLDMPAEERNAYVRANNNRVPLTPVWQGFDFRFQLLLAVTRHLDQERRRPSPSAA